MREEYSKLKNKKVGRAVAQVALPVGFYGSLQWIGWLSLLDEVALNHWNTHASMVRSERLFDIVVKETENDKYV